MKDVFRDIVALEGEFDGVDVNLRAGTLSVVVGPITLLDVELGAFRIELDLDGVARAVSSPYAVIALTPHPAESNSDVTHPHVQDDALCEGAGREAIRRALREGRLLDFFMVVANILRTYNPNGPYVALADWSGARCGDCDDLVSPDRLGSCRDCAQSVCDDCSVACGQCQGACCGDCLSSCASCDEPRCQDCLSRLRPMRTANVRNVFERRFEMRGLPC